MTYQTSTILKTEATLINVNAPKDTKMGQLVDYPIRNKKLVALTDEIYGNVAVAPHNCTIDLSAVKLADITKGGMTADQLITEGDGYGIIYIGEPRQEDNSPSLSPSPANTSAKSPKKSQRQDSSSPTDTGVQRPQATEIEN